MKRMLLIALVTALAACGSSPEKRAVAACEKEIAAKLSGKSYVIDKADMAAKAKPDGEDILQIYSTVVFDQGLPSESKQAMECRVQFDPKNRSADPSVIRLNFTW